MLCAKLVFAINSVSTPDKTLVTVVDIFGKEKTMVINIGSEEFHRCYHEWLGGKLIQHAFPSLTADEREFILTGMTPEEWDAMTKEEV